MFRSLCLLAVPDTLPDHAVMVKAFAMVNDHAINPSSESTGAERTGNLCGGCGLLDKEPYACLRSVRERYWLESLSSARHGLGDGQ